MGFSFSAAAAVIGVSLLIILEVFSSGIFPVVSTLNQTFKGLKERLINQDDTYINITNITRVGWWNTNWQYRKLLLINHDDVEASQSNFTVLVDITDGLFKTHAQSDGDDFAFIASDNKTQYHHQIELYTSTTGRLIAWVNITHLYHDKDTWFFLYYGNSGASNQEHRTGTWDKNYSMVLHLNESSGTLQDSTINNNDGTATGARYTASGKIDGAYDFIGTSSQYVRVSTLDNGNHYETGEVTISLWVKADITSSNTALISDYYSNAFAYYGWSIGVNLNGYLTYTIGNGIAPITITGKTNVIFGGSTWNHIVVVDRGETQVTGKNTTIYVNGHIDIDANRGVKATNANRRFTIGAKYTSAGNTNFFTGTIDEVRVSTIGRSNSSIYTNYHTMNSPSGFLQKESETTQSYTYLNVTIENKGSTNLNTEKFTLLVNGTKTNFITIQPYLYPNKNTTILASVWYNTTVYSSTNDAYAYVTNSNYNTAHNSLSGIVTLGNYVKIGQMFTPGIPSTYTIYRGFFFFDTSTLTSSATILNANVSLFGYLDSSGTDFSITIRNGQPTYPHNPLVIGDYYYLRYTGDGGSLGTSGYITTGYNTIIMNSTGRGWINKTSTTKLCLLSSRDISITTPTGGEYVTVYSSDIGTGYKPKLTVVYNLFNSLRKNIRVITENGKVDYGEITL